MFGGREEGAGWWAWEHAPGRADVGGLEGAVGDWRADPVKKGAENTVRSQLLSYRNFFRTN